MKLIIYGSDCRKCQQLTANTETAAKTLDISYEIKEVTDASSIIEAGIMRTPALAIDNDIVIEGKVANVEEIKRLLA